MFILFLFVILVANFVEMVLTLAGWYYPNKIDVFLVYSWAILGIVNAITNLHDKEKK